ncbi:efflux RND transporter periplasmic adaptor subunit [Lichenihabitans psoromatis]|uniref:efflux RND transporter periplasmic adaptor subunit n=1 Tax=Lichenihabitans psoromatis TaxID=2528642 RepID=UPI0010363E93|nr:efflux RND transporter periplasmic adaptor subunit [Lichenihabitans psoromatis]
MRKRSLLIGTALALVAAAAVYGYGEVERGHWWPRPAVASAQGAPPQAMPVPVTKVVKKTIPIVLDYSARTESIRAITLQAKVSAYVLEQAVPDGSDVKTGDLLYRLDPRDFQVALDQANAQIARDSASLDYQKSNFHRGDELSKSGWLAKDSYDQRASTMRQAEASLLADNASVRAAQLNLDYTSIRAPFPGRLGRNQAPVGTLVSTGGTVLNTLVQLDPIYVAFNPGETDLAAIQKAKQTGPVTVDISVPGETTASHKGELSFVDNTVDRSTGTVTARATIDNKDLSLLPGQYVRVRVHVRDQPDALMVPQIAIGSSQLGKYVMVVGAGETVEQHLVTLGPTSGDLVALLTGVAENDRVIVGNLQKIGPGMPVKALPEQPAAAPPP